MERAAATYVEETRFGFWFLQSHVWQHHVLRVAINDLKRLIDAPLPQAPVLLDAGCGQGRSFRLLQEAFAPARLIGLDGYRLNVNPEGFLLVYRNLDRPGSIHLAGYADRLLDILLEVNGDLGVHQVVRPEKLLQGFFDVCRGLAFHGQHAKERIGHGAVRPNPTLHG